MAHGDHALDPVDELDRLDATLEHGEEHALIALVRCVLARSQADVGRDPGELLALGDIEPAKSWIAPISSVVTTLQRR